MRHHLPNQDAILWKDNLCDGTAAILAVADGHGSADHFRSDQGSKIAVNLAVKALQATLGHMQEQRAPLSGIRRDLEDRLPRQLVHAWMEAVSNDRAASPFSREELAALEEKAGSSRRKNVENRPELAYGCTLLAVLVTRSFALYLQIGDGDILVVSADGEVSRPLEKDPRLIANETTSLCSPEAWKNVCLAFQVFSGSSPVLVLASTDGYSNAFLNDEAFLQVGRDLLEMSRTRGLDELGRSLESWLSEASNKGSGDDVTLGIIKQIRDTDLDQIGRRFEELHKSSRQTSQTVQEMSARLGGLERLGERMGEMELQIASLEGGMREKLSRLDSEIQELAQSVEAQAQEQRNRETAIPRRRWSEGAAWVALALAGLALFSLLLPRLLTLSNVVVSASGPSASTAKPSGLPAPAPARNGRAAGQAAPEKPLAPTVENPRGEKPLEQVSSKTENAGPKTAETKAPVVTDFSDPGDPPPPSGQRDHRTGNGGSRASRRNGQGHHGRKPSTRR
jgi:hypothetical protein